MKQKASPAPKYPFFSYQDAKVLRKFLSAIKATKALSVDGFIAILDLNDALLERLKVYDRAMRAIFEPYPEIKGAPNPLNKGEIEFKYKGHRDQKLIEKKLADLNSKDLSKEIGPKLNILSPVEFQSITPDFQFKTIGILSKYLLKPADPKK